MYLIYTSGKNKTYLEIVKKIYNKNKLNVQECEVANVRYILVNTHPAKVLPEDVLKRLIIQEVEYSKIIKFFTPKIDSIIEDKDILKPNTEVIITQGPYKGFKGIIQKILKNRQVEVLVSVFGRPAIVTVSNKEVLPLKNFS